MTIIAAPFRRLLAAKSGVSSSMISDVERGAKSPTIATASALAQALGAPLSVLLENAARPLARIHVVRAGERTEFIDPTSRARRDVFRSALTESRAEFMRYAVPRRAVAGPFPAHPSGTIEHMYVAAGNIRLVFGTEEAGLETGDFCSCFADAPHQFDNSKGKVEALIYIVVERP
jgi:transcriptional regulator with XRE-family HTH domain